MFRGSNLGAAAGNDLLDGVFSPSGVDGTDTLSGNAGTDTGTKNGEDLVASIENLV